MRDKSINVNLPISIHKRLRRAADAERRSLRQQIVVFLRDAADRYDASGKTGSDADDVDG